MHHVLILSRVLFEFCFFVCCFSLLYFAEDDVSLLAAEVQYW